LAQAASDSTPRLSPGAMEPSQMDPTGGNWGRKRKRFPDGFKPRKLCAFFQEGRCHKADQCTFAHGEEELAPEAGGVEGDEDGVGGNGAQFYQDASAEAPEASAEQVEQEQEVAEGAEEEGVAISESACIGPREFAPGFIPKQLCTAFLQHPMMCAKGDGCMMAHGLFEMGVEGACAIRVDGNAAKVAKLDAKAEYGGKAEGGKGMFGAPPPWADPRMSKGLGKAAAMMALPSMAYSAMAYMGMGGPPPDPSVNRFADTGFMPSRVCQFWIRDPNMCHKGAACSFAHGVHELQPSAVETCGVSRFLHTGIVPTKLCTFFAEGRCQKGLLCTFGHSPEELRVG